MPSQIRAPQSLSSKPTVYDIPGQTTYKVPSGANALKVTLEGSQGLEGAALHPTGAKASDGGLGAELTATIPVSAGKIYYVEVGALNGGGPALSYGAQGGGGESAIQTCSIDNISCAYTGTVGDPRLLVAGGGGGGGLSYDNLADGDNGGNAGVRSMTGAGMGGAGTADAALTPGAAGGDGGVGGTNGGVGGDGISSLNGDPTTAETGAPGVGGICNYAGSYCGGGGAGWFGGGGGGDAGTGTGGGIEGGGGGGGSSYYEQTAVDVTLRTQTAGQGSEVVITALHLVKPKITAKITSTSKLKRGVYHAPVNIRFTCKTGTGKLVGKCPKSLNYTKNGTYGPIKKTIKNSAGLTATVTIKKFKVKLKR